MPKIHDANSDQDNSAETGDLKSLEQRLGHRFADAGRLAEALRHPSDTEVQNGALPSNQRLEFLGDRVLGLIVSEWLLERYPDEAEGEIARRHTDLVRREALARAARHLGLGNFIAMSKGEDDAGGRRNPSLLADACEAVIAAIYLDGGLGAAAAFIRGQWAEMIEAAPEPPVDAKTALQEWAQARGLDLPRYRETGREGPAHAPKFTIEADVSGYPTVVGEGASKRAAEQRAAEALLAKLEQGNE
ncbi:MAG: ribonuclease III [Rhodospirillales bacterium]|mgnify:CR=1 FL=1|jgi:ribonuclease-3|nr:ribonuclease III [Rhodospirillaceae bacterium]MDP6430073.1 ribonuclease III [Rhodospirillales bacterium]MDP6643113.1 ribonuclease III [Rhodospirillales bacterium]MDP6842978.1 ribonuclease III [Rhodospirillales bacterium]